MQEDRWQRVKEICYEALDLPERERERYVYREANGDGEIVAEVLSLLAVDEEPVSFLEAHPAMDDEGPDPLLSAVLGGYLLSEKLDSGGMGTVYIGHQPGSEERVAIKVLKRGMDTDEIVRRFRREQHILRSLDHPYITTHIDGGTTEDGRPYLVMEFEEGAQITDFFRERDLPIQERMRIFQRVCVGVAYAHQKRVVHRDLKPGNILVDELGYPKLLDFGIAKLLDQEIGATRTDQGLRLLTPAYAAPEQLAGGKITTSCDIYALGVLLYEILVGRLPERTGAATTTGARARVEAPSRAVSRERLPRSVPQKHLVGDVDAIVLRAMREDPEERYASVDEMIADIDRFLGGARIRRRGERLNRLLIKLIRRHRIHITITAAIVLLLLLTTITLGIRLVSSERERETLAVASRQQQAALARRHALTEFYDRLLIDEDPETRVFDRAREILLGEAENPGQALLREIAVRAEARGRFDVALQLMEAAVSREATSEALLALARLHHRSGEDGLSATLVAWVLDGPDVGAQPAARLLACAIALRRHDLEEAETHLSRYAASSPAAIALQAEIAIRKGREVAAEGTLRSALLRWPDALPVLEKLAALLLAQTRYEEAIVIVDRGRDLARARNGCQSEPYGRFTMHLGRARLALGDVDRAYALTEEALAAVAPCLPPEHPLLVTFLLAGFRAGLARGDLSTAAEKLRHAEAIASARPECVDLVAVQLAAAQQALAEGALNRVRELVRGIEGDRVQVLQARVFEVRSWLLGGDEKRVRHGLSELFMGLDRLGLGGQLEAALLMTRLARDLEDLGYREEALTFSERALGLRELLLGREHPRTRESLEMVALLEEN